MLMCFLRRVTFIAVALTFTAKPAVGQGLAVPCPANTPCTSLYLTSVDATHFTLKLTLDLAAIKRPLIQFAMPLVNQNLPLSVTREVQIASVKYINARIGITSVMIGEPAPHTGTHPIPLPPPVTPTGVAITGVIYKNEKDLKNFPLPPHWDDAGWPQVATYICHGKFVIAPDAGARIGEQKLNISASLTDADGVLTRFFAGKTFSFQLNKQFGLSIPIMDASDAAGQGLAHSRVERIDTIKVDDRIAIYLMTVGPEGLTRRSDNQESLK